MTKGKVFRILGVIILFGSLALMSYHFFSESTEDKYVIYGSLMITFGLLLTSYGKKIDKS